MTRLLQKRRSVFILALGTKGALSFMWQHVIRRGISTSATVSEVLEKAKYPSEWPFSRDDFSRQDESVDANFYNFERFCYHIDERAVEALREHYSKIFREFPKPDILDVCASHVSHFPHDIADFAGKRVALGMNEIELKANEQCTDYVVKDLNLDPKLPFDDNSFHIVTNCVSIDYLTKPLEVCKEVARVLRPGGVALFALSNRCFPTKAVNIWLKTNDLEHVFIVASYFHYTECFQRPTALEITPVRDTFPWMAGSSQNEAYLTVVRADLDQ